MFDQFENVSFDVWHNLQEFPQVDDILSLQNLSIDVSQITSKVFFGVIVCGVN
jgi:hypothetical protein